MTMEELEKEIHKIQKSTKTLLRFFNPLHNKLRIKFNWYYRWHLHPYRHHFHYSALGVFIGMAATLTVIFSISAPRKSHAVGSAIAIATGSVATVVNTGHNIYFDSAANHTNVTIDNYTRQMSGYAWSDDLGWIDFGLDADNTQGPVVADVNGHLSGKAKFLNGTYVDFNDSPNNSNVRITSGNFSGYAWSDDLGWINFSGVSAPGYNPDLLPPDNPSSVTVRNVSGGTILSTDTWYNFPAPYFSWSVPSDNANGIAPSGVSGYYVYFGQNNSADPSNYQTNLDFTSTDLGTSYGTYYLRIKTKDTSGNISDPVTLFTYKYESAAPTAPTYVSVSPSGYSRTNTFTFSWPISGSSAASDAGGSGLAKYQYKINSEASWHNIAGDAATPDISLSDIATQSINTFDLQAIDNAGNNSPSVRTNFYFNNSAPSAPRDLTVAPTSSTSNAFAFSWTAPPGEIAGYYYSINAIPTDGNSSYTTNTSLASGPYATQQENTFYIVAKDNAGNYDFGSCNNVSGNPTVDGCAKVNFTANVVAPGIPGGIQAYDISDRDTKDYAVAVKWSEPIDKGTGFAGYDVYRSLNGTNFSKIGSTTSTIYADGDLESKAYYYYARSKDSIGNSSANSSIVSIKPTGRFTTAPKLVSGPKIEVKPTSLVVRWATDRACSSFVQIKEGNTFVSEQGQTVQATDHEVTVVGLRSQRDYIYSIRSTDIDGNTLTGDGIKFTTANTPSVYDLNISNITQQSAIVNFKSTAIANFTMYYGETANFGSVISEDSSSSTTNHSIALSNLKPGQMYYFRVIGDDADGNELRSENSFSTLPMPSISKFGIEPDKEAPSTTLKIAWQTNVPTSSIVKYSTDGVNFREQSTSDLVLDHEIMISELVDQSEYTIYASGRDQFGNVAESNKITFDTPTDSRAPKISDIIIEASNVGNSTDKAQIAISWKTDEPADSQVEYDTGLTGNDYTRKTSLDSTYTKHHLVIISDLVPGKPYHLRILTTDIAGNLTKSGDNTVITGEVSRSALQIILNTMQNLFGWMGKLFK